LAHKVQVHFKGLAEVKAILGFFCLVFFLVVYQEYDDLNSKDSLHVIPIAVATQLPKGKEKMIRLWTWMIAVFK